MRRACIGTACGRRAAPRPPPPPPPTPRRRTRFLAAAHFARRRPRSRITFGRCRCDVRLSRRVYYYYYYSPVPPVAPPAALWYVMCVARIPCCYCAAATPSYNDLDDGNYDLGVERRKMNTEYVQRFCGKTELGGRRSVG